jgi:hypothetical protein
MEAAMRLRRLSYVCLLLFASSGIAQIRDYRIHQRGMLHQTVYNTGELGRAYDNGVGGMVQGFSSMEWPPNSQVVLNRTLYAGQHNSFGGGLWIAGTRPGGRQYMYCGAVSDASGNPVPVVGIYSIPISIERIENFPLLPNGNVNPAYDPNDAEEKIIAQWGTPLGVTVTRTSRAWSFPGYDGFIIYEYELQNTTADTIKDLDAVWTYGFGPSMFGYQRTYNRWGEIDYRGQNGEGSHFGRFDLKRWMIYNHEREGRPDTEYFDIWSQPGNRGGLNSPQAAGMMMLYYDYAHLATRAQTQQVWPVPNDSAGIWDVNEKVKQPFLHRYENGNLPPTTKNQLYLDPTIQRRTGVFVGASDSTRILTQLKPATIADWYYWKGRTKGSVNLSWYQPVVHFYGFYPYLLPPNQTLRFAVAEVVGYGPGVAGDRIYTDLGGNIRAGVDAGTYFNPIPSWYDTLQYPYLGPRPYIGSSYLQTHSLPWYVTPGVVSIRDVADRAIQAFTGQPLLKYDSLQYEPVGSRPNGVGAYNTIPIPVPSPVISVFSVMDTVRGRVVNRMSWGPQVEPFSVPRLRAPFTRYSVMRAPEPLGPWRQLDTVGRLDPRYFRDSVYVFEDDSVLGGQIYCYSVLSIDALGGKSGMTNMTMHVTPTDVGEASAGDNPYRFALKQNYPNPFNPVTTFQFSIVNRQLTILKVYDVLGREVATLVNEVKEPGTHTVQWDASGVASGVYYYRLSVAPMPPRDLVPTDGRDGQAGKFSETRKMILLR